MRAITMTQPWAGLIASGHKPIENRPRRMIKRDDFGNPFGVHASREIDEDVYDLLKSKFPWLFVPVVYREWQPLSRITSAVIATAVIEREVYQGTSVLGGTLSPESLTDDEREWFFDDRPGNIGYVIRAPHRLHSPVSCSGRQGFWTMPRDVEAKVRNQLARAA